MSYNLPKALTSEYQSPSIKIEDFKMNSFNPFNPTSITGGSENLNLLLQMSYNIPKMLSSEFQTCSIKIEDLKINPINPFSMISTN